VKVGEIGSVPSRKKEKGWRAGKISEWFDVVASGQVEEEQRIATLGRRPRQESAVD